MKILIMEIDHGYDGSGFINIAVSEDLNALESLRQSLPKVLSSMLNEEAISLEDIRKKHMGIRTWGNLKRDEQIKVQGLNKEAREEVRKRHLKEFYDILCGVSTWDLDDSEFVIRDIKILKGEQK